MLIESVLTGPISRLAANGQGQCVQMSGPANMSLNRQLTVTAAAATLLIIVVIIIIIVKISIRPEATGERCRCRRFSVCLCLSDRPSIRVCVCNAIVCRPVSLQRYRRFGSILAMATVADLLYAASLSLRSSARRLLSFERSQVVSLMLCATDHNDDSDTVRRRQKGFV